MIWQEDKLQEEDESNEHRASRGKPKATVQVLLVHEVPKQEQGQQQVQLHMKG